MSGFRAFVRQLGFQPGVQLNPILDATDGAVPDNSDQIPATIARLTRGRIDRPFRVNRTNFYTKTGGPASIRSNALNEAKVQVYEELQNGAFEAVIQRLTPAAAAKSYAVMNIGSGANLTATVGSGGVTGITVVDGGTGYVTGDSLVFGGPGTGAVATITATAGVITSATVTTPGTGYSTAPTVKVAASPVFTVSASKPTENFVAWLMHHDCFNDGIKWAFHADTLLSSGTAVATKDVEMRVYDSAGALLDEFEGSLDPDAKDDFGQTKYLPDLIAARSESYEMGVATGKTIDPNTTFYGRDTSNKDKWVTSATLVCFSEGGTTYANSDYDRCIDALRDTVSTPFGYLTTGGTKAIALFSKIGALGIEINTPVGADIPGDLGVAAAIAFAESLNLDSHYIHCYWAPLEADDPMNGGKAIWGAAGLNIAMRCARNARINAKGFAPKNYPVAGKDWPLNRTGVRQLVRPSEQDLSDLARAKINPVIFETYNGGGRYVFTDSLTSAKSVVSYKKLINVAEMSSTIDTWVTLYAKELLQLPMTEFIRRMNAFLQPLFEGAQASGWLVPSKNLEGNAAFQFRVQKSEVRPADLVLIDYWTSYDGVARQVIVQQTLVK
ncbi:MAG: hypothetical protein LCH79_16025 [Proteobacteria bacterium]|nr:hypothetical protein [Pseudomonadota bacterium]